MVARIGSGRDRGEKYILIQIHTPKNYRVNLGADGTRKCENAIHTYVYIYIYIFISLCVCVCLCTFLVISSIGSMIHWPECSIVSSPIDLEFISRVWIPPSPILVPWPFIRLPEPVNNNPI